jgi:5-methylcytosine-specific restriction endonuclease McrA
MQATTILLNGDYTFLNVVSWKRAICLLAKGKCEVLKYSEDVIRTFGGVIIKIPLIMKLVKIVRMIYRNKVPFSKRNVFVRDKFFCMYCGKKEKDITIDHVIPISKGGKSEFDNCVTACKPCNAKKANRTPREAGMFLRKRPHTPTISEFLSLKLEHYGVRQLLDEFIGG